MSSDDIEDFKGEFRFLSNFGEFEFKWCGKLWPSSEHAYQAAKTEDEEEAEMVRKAPSPGKSKKWGRRITLRENWDDIKIDVMFDIVRHKFKDRELSKRLLATGDKNLIEGNWWGDVFWGVCKGQGLNHLGKVLMQVRDEIRNGYLEEAIEKNPVDWEK